MVLWVQKHRFDVCFSVFVFSLSLLFMSNVFAQTGESKGSTQNNDKIVNREVTRSIVSYYLENGKFNEAVVYLNDHLQEDPNDAENFRVLGLLYSRLEKWKDAIQVLKKAVALTQEKERGINLYYLAHAQRMAKDTEGAAESESQLHQIAGFSKASEKAQLAASSGQNLPKLEIAEEEIQVHKELQNMAPVPRVAVSLTAGHDSNVLLLTDLNSIPGVTSPSYFIKPAVQTQKPITLWDKVFVLQGSASYTHNFTRTAGAYDNIPLVVGVDHQLTNFHAAKYGLALNFSEDVTWLNSDGMKILSVGETLSARGTPLKGKGWLMEFTFPVSYRHYADTGTPENLATGFAVNPTVTMRHAVSSFSFSETLLAGRQFSYGTNARSYMWGGALNIIKELMTKRLTATFDLNYAKTFYPEFVSKRIDQLTSADLILTMYVHSTHPLAFQLTAAQSHNASTLDSSNYSKTIFSLGVTYEAF